MREEEELLALRTKNKSEAEHAGAYLEDIYEEEIQSINNRLFELYKDEYGLGIFVRSMERLLERRPGRHDIRIVASYLHVLETIKETRGWTLIGDDKCVIDGTYTLLRTRIEEYARLSYDHHILEWIK